MFGAVITFEIPDTPDEAFRHASDSVADPGTVYLWQCPTADGTHHTLERLELDVSVPCDSDILRVPTVFVPVPILLVNTEDPAVKQAAEHILSKTEGYPDRTRIAAALNFVQSAIGYASDTDLYGCTEFWATPAETLYFHRGDCEDTTVLLMSILGAMGYDPVLLDYDGHEAVGVPQGDQPGDYLFCETAADVVTIPTSVTGDPDVYGIGSISPMKETANGFIAFCREIVRKVAGT